MIITIIIVVGYILPAVLDWFAIRKLYTKGGKWEGLIPYGREVLILFIPVLNWISLLKSLSVLFKKNKENLIKKFFNLK
jgi:hypothetical protein